MLTISTIIGTSSAIILHEFNTFAVQFGGFGIRWYALAYIAGLMLGWRYVIMLSQSARLWPQGPPAGREAIDDLLMWVTFGVILGGRLGYVILYNPGYFVAQPGGILINAILPYR